VTPSAEGGRQASAPGAALCANRGIGRERVESARHARFSLWQHAPVVDERADRQEL
jgi:hypothetical protein